MRILLSVIGVSVALLTIVNTPVVADQDDISPEKQTLIRQNCVTAQVALQQIQYSDAATRVNRGQGYESLLSRLIVPLNTRATANGFNNSATNLTATTNKYQTALNSFKKHYDNYDDALTDALRVKCQDKPIAFYHYLVEARKQRSSLANDVTTLTQLIEEYHQNAIKLRSEVQNGAQ